jgi:predicted nucleic-acid-binding protein
MRGLDTNVLARYVMADDAAQLAAAADVIESCQEEGEAMFVPAVVLCELVWVLERSYGQNRDEILRALHSLVLNEAFRLEHADLVRRSLVAYREGRGGFSDYLIGEISRQAGCRDVVTFDQDLRGAAGFTVLA